MQARIKPNGSMLITRGRWPGSLSKFRSRKSEAASANRRRSQLGLEILHLTGLRRGLAKGFFSFALVAGIAVFALAEEPAQGRKIVLPVPIGHEVRGLRVPVRNDEGKMEMQFDMESAKRLNDQDIEMHVAIIQTFDQQTAKPDAKIELKTAVMNFDTNVIKTSDPVRVSREDFVLTADGGEFNSKLRQGRVVGEVHLIIYNRDEFQTKSGGGGQQQ
jgi:hypothetical protein